MTKFITAAKKFVKGEEGATMVEYGLMVALIAIVAMAGAALVGNSVNAKFSTVASSIGGAGS